MVLKRKKAKRSIRTIIIMWFLLLSLLPLIFVAYYSSVKYEQAIDKELLQRLSVNSREIEVILADFKSGLQVRRDRYLKDPYLVYNLSISDRQTLNQLASEYIMQEFSSELIFFNRDARQVSKVIKNDKNDVITVSGGSEATFLSEKYISVLKTSKDIPILEYANDRILLTLLSRVNNQSKKTIGYIQQKIYLDSAFINRLKNRLKLEFVVGKEDTTIILASFKGWQDAGVSSKIQSVAYSKDPIVEVPIKNIPYGFYVSFMEWGHSRFLLSLGVSKSDSREVLKNINLAYFSVVGVVIIFLIILVVITSKWILAPLNNLVDALHSFESQEQAVTIPVKNDTEIGLLTESFNQMSINISQARNDLKKKVQELEAANRELKETQKKLVHSAKMISLGELVAGVAHELNNPISFIYSNMSYLRDYSAKLIDLVRSASQEPATLEKKKAEVEFEYIVSDLPKLISSCEEGARRTRDIVLGLRNFSRIDESQIKEVDIRETIDATLNLLQGELKNRIEVKKDYEPIPPIKCFASQLSQVFVNLLSNAIQAIPGSGTIWIHVSLIREKENWVQISIQDSGNGITPEHLDKIFDPFFTTKGVGQGTGLGLSITYGIIQKHGGDIQVKSQVGVGTEFIIQLPIEPKLNKKA
ncbi:MAG: HAMP domain-containing protein [Bdellovibrionaceae bacterium]|nr:HAMP domain-containing protein [Pseudobdellovibrionaceae bacterium]